jgi:CheY-like chemotaxis protein
MRVLIVDANRDAADSMALLLSLMGCDVRTAYTSPEALELTASFRPQVVFTELVIPRFDGYKIARSIRDSLGERSPLLVALTGLGRKQDRARSKEAGFDFHLVKPANPDDVTELLVYAADRDS